MKQADKKLVLENGMEFPGFGAGAANQVVGELIFNTSVEGYQESLSDPANYQQIIVYTYPMIGQYGINRDDFVSIMPAAVGFVVHELCDTPSNFRSVKTVADEFIQTFCPVVTGVDTRMITRIIRDGGSLLGAIVDASVSRDDAMRMIREYKPSPCPVKDVSCKERRYVRTSHHRFDVVVLDCGVNGSIIDELNKRACNVTLAPYDATAGELRGFDPDAILITNGPGSVSQIPQTVEAVRTLRGTLPMLGLGLGCQLLAATYGAKIEKLKCGHHGGRPVKSTENGRIYSAEHNYSNAIVDAPGLEVTFRDLTDGSVQGIRNVADKVVGYQFYPCGTPGPQDCSFLLDEFVKMMED